MEREDGPNSTTLKLLRTKKCRGANFTQCMRTKYALIAFFLFIDFLKMIMNFFYRYKMNEEQITVER